MTVDAVPVLEMQGIRKAFPGVIALDAVTLTLYGGEVHILLGENGAGKSTLMKILSGAYSKDAGEIRLQGQPVEIRSPADALAHGIRVICVCPSEVQTSFGGRGGRNNPNKLYAEDIARTIMAGIDMPRRALWPELAVFATNPWKED